MSDALTDSLKSLDLDAPAFYSEQDSTGRDVKVTLHEDIAHRRTAAARTFWNLSRIGNAARHIHRLPELGESIHGIMRGNFDAFDFVPAMMGLFVPATIAELNIATLGFNERNTDALLHLVDAGAVGHCTFICSHFYKTHEGEVYTRLHHELTGRGHQCMAMRCHAKMLLFETTDARRYVIEMSANLRSCRNLEQFTITRDDGLHTFHQAWMSQLFGEAQL